jgi:predicted transcriptional regulator
MKQTEIGQNTAKDRAIAAIRELPEDATVEDVMERLCFLAKVEEGMRQADVGQTLHNVEVSRRILG